jgi:hypothetical protein
MCEKLEHTPTPWALTESGTNGKNVEQDKMAFFCDTTGKQKANAKHIVKCVNMHDGLLNSLEKLLLGLDHVKADNGFKHSIAIERAVKQANKLLKRAKESS